MEIKLHPSFELNGTSFKKTHGLLQFSESLSKPIYIFFKQFFDEADAVKLQTSGSTGSPKLIEIKKEYMVNSALATGDFFNLGKGTTALLCMNPEFIAGKMMLVRALILGWKLDVVTPSLNPLKDVKGAYDFSAMVPLQVLNSLDDLNKVKKLIIGGGVLSNDLINKIQQKKTHCFATYGMTETVSHIAVKKLNNYPSLRGGTTKQSVYTIFPKISISTDQRNCLVIDASNISETTVITNDIVKLISKTSFEWLGRFDNIINSGGIKLIPEQIEEKLSKIIDQRFFVVGIPDNMLGEKLVLVVEAQRDKGAKIQSEMENLKSLLKYETPKEIYFIDKFVETDTKKIQRKKTLQLVIPNS
ncbi:MAG: AMP-binding protein [Flavobacteriaceae bacterium]